MLRLPSARNCFGAGYIKGIIGLPPNLFYGTGIPACIVVLDKRERPRAQGRFMIDASKGFIKDGPKNRLRSQDIHKIVDVFNKQMEVDGYSRMVPMHEIASEANNYNLNIPRYIDSSESEDIQDLPAHIHGGLTAPLTRIQGAPVGRMARSESCLAPLYGCAWRLPLRHVRISRQAMAAHHIYRDQEIYLPYRISNLIDLLCAVQAQPANGTKETMRSKPYIYGTASVAWDSLVFVLPFNSVFTGRPDPLNCRQDTSYLPRPHESRMLLDRRLPLL